MRHKRILPVLIGVLALSCLIVGLSLFALTGRDRSLPDRTLSDLVQVLEEERITVDPALIPGKRENKPVYVCDSDDYDRTVAALLCGSTVQESYRTPDGEIIRMANGARVDFGDRFSFHYYRDGTAVTENSFPLEKLADSLGDTKKEQIGNTVSDFLSRGSRSFKAAEDMMMETVVETIWENDGVYYALCRRTVSGVPVTNNAVLCAVQQGEVSEAYGTWSFLTTAETYPAQLTDMVNILFNLKKEIAGEDHGEVTVLGIDSCYSLYYYDREEAFCLIPCWLIQTDSEGDFVYNAINGTLYTKS